MAEGILKFNLSEEDNEFRLALNASKWYGVVWDVDQVLRNKLKHGEITDEARKAYEEIREELHSSMTDHGIDFE
jgi:hypothetical protein